MDRNTFDDFPRIYQSNRCFFSRNIFIFLFSVDHLIRRFVQSHIELNLITEKSMLDLIQTLHQTILWEYSQPYAQISSDEVGFFDFIFSSFLRSLNLSPLIFERKNTLNIV